MLAAYIWYWWIGLILVIGAIAGVILLIVLYLKTVTAKKYEPGSSRRSRRSAADL
jgi:hypothetical protein